MVLISQNISSTVPIGQQSSIASRVKSRRRSSKIPKKSVNDKWCIQCEKWVSEEDTIPKEDTCHDDDYIRCIDCVIVL